MSQLKCGRVEHYLELKDNKSSKFWSIKVEGVQVTTRWGKIGATGQSKTKEYPDAGSALQAAQEQLADKRSSGYVSLDAPELGPGQDAISKIERWLAARAPKFLKAMERGASPEELKDLENYLGVPLPASLSRLLAWRGKERPAGRLLCFHWPYGERLSLAEVRRLHQTESQDCDSLFSLDELGWAYPLPSDWYPEGCWNRLWVPIFFDQGNDWATVLVDLEGSFGGKPGQVILKQGAGPALRISLLSDSLEDYLNVLHESMIAGLWGVSDTIEPLNGTEFDEFLFERFAQTRPFEVYPNEGLAEQARVWINERCEISRALDRYLDPSASEGRKIDLLAGCRPDREISLIHWEYSQLLLSLEAADRGEFLQALDFARAIRWTIIQPWEGELAARLLKKTFPALPAGSSVNQEDWIQAPDLGRPQFAWRDHPERARLSYPVGGWFGCVVHSELELLSDGQFRVLHLSKWPCEAWMHLLPVLQSALSPSEIAQHLAKAAYHLFQSGSAGEAMALLDRAMDVCPEDTLAGRSREALKSKGATSNKETDEAVAYLLSIPPPRPRDFVLQPHPCLWWRPQLDHWLGGTPAGR